MDFNVQLDQRLALMTKKDRCLLIKRGFVGKDAYTHTIYKSALIWPAIARRNIPSSWEYVIWPGDIYKRRRQE